MVIIGKMSCLFESIGYFLKIDPNSVRQCICDYLRDNKPVIEGIDTATVLEIEGGPEYVENMRNASQWGGGIELNVACNLWNVRIIVKKIDGVMVEDDPKKNLIDFIPLSGEYDSTFNLFWNGEHYEPFRGARFI